MIAFLKRLWSWLLAFFWKPVPAAVKEEPRPTGICWGIDFGGIYDNTVVAIIERSTLEVLDVVLLRHAHWQEHQAKLVQLVQRWQPTLILGDVHGLGGARIEILQAEGFPIRPYSITAKSKIELTQALAEALNSGRLKVQRGDYLQTDNTALALAFRAATAYVVNNRIVPYA